MRLLSLFVEGFKTFAEPQTFDFTAHPEDGLCFVTGVNEVDPDLGANGSGKSTLMDSVCYALYGKTSRGLKAGDVASWQVSHDLAIEAEARAATGGKKMTKKASTPSVTTRISFTNHSGDTCTINRRWNPNVLTLQIAELEPKNVDQAELDSMIGYNFDEFLQAAYFSQFQDLFLDMGSAERSALVAKVLNLDVWDKYSDNAKHDADTQKHVIEEDRRQIERLKGQIDELESQDLSEQIAEWEEERKAELLGLQAQHTEHLKLEKSVTAAAKKAETACAASKKRVMAIEDKLESTIQEIIRPFQEAYEDEIALIDSSLTQLEESYDDTDESAENRDFKKEIRHAENVKSKYEIELSQVEKDMDSIEATAKKIEALEGDCSQCGQPITDEHVDHELDSCDAQLEKLEAKADGLESSLLKAKKTLRKVEDDASEYEAEVKEKARAHKDAVKAIRLERSNAEQAHKKIMKDQEKEARSVSWSELKGAQDDYEASQEAQVKATSELKNWKNLAEDLKADCEDCEDEKNPHSVLQEKNLKRLKALNKDREDAFTSLEHKVDDEQASRYWVRGFKSVKLYAVSNALNELEAEVNSALDGLGLGGWSVEFDVDKENKSGTLSKGFFAFINGPDNLDPVKWEAWSGGESQRLRLAASLGLANMIRASKGLELPFEIWDEPSQWMSDAGIAGLLDVLQRRAKRLKRQIWLIDHRGLEHPFDSVICVTKKLQGSTIANVTNTFGS